MRTLGVHAKNHTHTMNGLTWVRAHPTHTHTQDPDELTGAESMIKNATDSVGNLDIGWLPQKISHRMQLKGVEADLEDQNDIIKDLKEDIFVKLDAQNEVVNNRLVVIEEKLKNLTKGGTNGS